MKLNKKIIQISAVTALLVLVFLTVPQFNNVQAFLGGNVSGEVTCDGTSVQGATVSLIVDETVEATDTTDANGDYYVRYTDLLQQTIECTIKVEKSGYTTIYRDTYLYPSTGTDLDIEWEITQTCNGYVYDDASDPISSATVKLKDGLTVLDSDTTDVNGYYSFSEEVQENLYCELKAENTSVVFNSLYIYCSDQTTSHNFRTVEKIAVFFYATDAITESYIDNFGDQLEAEEGFDTIIYHENTGDWEGDMEDLDDIEGAEDYVFIHVMTHGNYESGTDESDCTMQDASLYQNPDKMYSSEFGSSLDDIESDSIFVIIGSCYSGDFIDDCKGANRFIITTTDEDSLAYRWFDGDPIPNVEPSFEHFFFERISDGYSDSSAFTYATTETQDDWPYQDPLYDDQLSYTWFLYW